MTALIAVVFLGLAALTSCSSGENDVEAGAAPDGGSSIPGDEIAGSDEPFGGDEGPAVDITTETPGGDPLGVEVAPPNYGQYGPEGSAPPEREDRPGNPGRDSSGDGKTPRGKPGSDDPDGVTTGNPGPEGVRPSEDVTDGPDTKSTAEKGTGSGGGGSKGGGSKGGGSEPSSGCRSPYAARDKSCFGTWTATLRPLGPDILEQLQMILQSSDGGQSRVIGQGAVEALLDGQQAVAARGDGGGHSHLFLQNVNGSGVRALTAGPYLDGLAAAGPGGRSVAFVRANALEQRANRGEPRGSAARSRVGVRGRTADQNFDIYTVGLEGQEPVRLTDDPALDTQPSWSPAGDRIAFVSDRDGDLDIYLMDPDGANVKRVTDNEDNEVFPTWSPDGKQIAYASDRDGDFEIYVVAADGSGIRRLTKNETDDLSPSWSPEGIAFTRDKGDQNEVYVLEAEDVQEAKQDPTVQKDRVTTNDAEDMLPTWSPTGDVIAFSRLETPD